MEITKSYQNEISNKLLEIQNFLADKYNGLVINDTLLDMVKFEIQEMLKTYVLRVLHKDETCYSLYVTIENGSIIAKVKFLE